MKIGVFGDSFACHNANHIWWRYLETNHGHQVTSFGEGGSSLGFSVECLDSHYKNFDRLIWCVTTVNRISIWHKDKIYHNTGTFKCKHTGDYLLDRKLDVIHQYLTEAFDFHFQEILGHALVHWMLDKHPNLMIVPSFSTPVYFMQEHLFNLYDLCKKEVQYIFPGQDAENIVNNSQDGRDGHLTDTNQRILARLIDANLDSRIFFTEYDNFCFDADVLRKEFGGKSKNQI